MRNSLLHLAAFMGGVLMMLTAGFGKAAGQVPVGTVGGSVTDSAGAVIVEATVAIRLEGTGAERLATTRADGIYRAENLPPGVYQIEVSAPGFRTTWRKLTLHVGDHLTLDFALQPGLPDEKVEITGEASEINTTDYGVHGSVSRAQVENLPLNGRNFLELAQLEPGVSAVSVTNPGGLGNNYHRVASAGAFYSQTRVSADGSTVTDRLIGGTTQNFSQESVQEFQISTFNFDPSTGLTGSGAINIVTRRGSNDLHGSAFFYYRDHHLAAYPALRRDPRNPAPFFARRQSGFRLGGPAKRDRLFWFVNYEHNNQDAVFAVTNNHPVFSKLDVIYPNPLGSDLFNLRLDAKVSDRHQAHLRASFDWNDTTAPAVFGGMPSNWQSVRNRALQVQGGVISVLTPQLVNDLRYSYGYLGGHLDTVSAEGCRDPVPCVGVGAPNVVVFDAPQFSVGRQFNSPFLRWQRNYQLAENLTWQRGEHRVRAGGEWEHIYLKAALSFLEPAQVVLWGPSNLQTPALRPLYDALPASLRDPNAPPPTLAEILRLPLRNFTTGIGDPQLPGPYNFRDASRNDRVRFYLQDSWRVRPSLTLTAGLAYAFETKLFDHDLDYPAYLAPLVGGDLNPPRRDANNFNPSLGLAWSLDGGGRTVVRAGGGVYTDEANFGWKGRGRAFTGPSGNGRVVVDGSLTGLNFLSTPTNFRGQDLLPLLPALRADLAARLGDGSDLTVRGVEVIKQGDQIVDPDSKTAYAVHLSGGVQRELWPGVVLTADYVMRRYVNVGALQGVFIIDRNRFNRPRVTGVNPATGVVSFVRDPVIPLCTAAQANALDPADGCSAGPINIFASGASYRYQGLHATLEKRFSAGWQFLVGYALSKNTGFVEFTEYDDYASAYGNSGGHRRHRLTLSGVWTPPVYGGDSRLGRGLLNRWTVAFISQAYGAPPLNTILAGLDLDGDGISRTLLPGTTHNSLGQGLSAEELRGLISQYNADVEARTRRVQNPDGSVTVIRPRTPFNQIINPLTLPDEFSGGDSFVTQDVRLTRAIKVREGVEVKLIGEVFNLFNVSNLTGYSDVLNQPNYGRPSGRAGQVFGSGGARAFQFAARLTF